MAVQTTNTRTAHLGGVASRVVLTALGAAGLIIGALLDFLPGIPGTDLDVSAFYRETLVRTGSLFETAGLVMIVLGLVAILGLAMRSGWLTRLAGALGIIAFVLFAIEVYRAPGGQVIQVGAWLCLGGGALALVGGFFGRSRPRAVVVEAPAVVATSDPAVTTIPTTSDAVTTDS